MTSSARDVAAEIRRRLPDVSVVKLHKLLYYAQGHHLAATGAPLFSETVSAWDMGPVVGTLWRAERDGDTAVAGVVALPEAALNTIGYVLHRYGGMTGRDLIRLTHGESPWLDADRGRPPGGRRTISTESMRTYFVAAGDDDGDDHGDDNGEDFDRSEQLAALLAGADARRRSSSTVDSIDDIRRRLTLLQR